MNRTLTICMTRTTMATRIDYLFCLARAKRMSPPHLLISVQTLVVLSFHQKALRKSEIALYILIQKGTIVRSASYACRFPDTVLYQDHLQAVRTNSCE